MQSGRRLELSGMLQLTFSSLTTSRCDLLFDMSRFLQKAACGILITHAACVCLDPWIEFSLQYQTSTEMLVFAILNLPNEFLHNVNACVRVCCT